MKKFLKITTITGVCLTLLGALTFGIAFGSAGWDVQELSNVKAEQKRYEQKADTTIENIVIDVENTDVRVVFDESVETISLDYSQRFKKNGDPIGKITLNDQNGGLRLIEKTSWTDHVLIWDFTADCKTTLTLPANNVYALSIETDNGDITVRGNGKVSSLSLTTDNGDISTKNATIDCTGKVSLESDNGGMALGNLSAKTIETETDNGNVKILGRLIAEQIFFETHNGNITATAYPIQINKIAFETHNGNITAHLFGASADYTKMIQTHNGDSNIHSEKGGEKTLMAETHNGDIEITFKTE